MRLVIVESPKKARTIQGFLGSGYRVAASMGHVRDLPAKALGVDVAQDFAPQYEVLPKAQKTLAGLRAAVRQAESVFLATDPDREGEAIAWHLAETLRLPKSRFRRIAFHEISRRAIQDALAQPRDLDPHLIDAQQARRVLDRLVGYQLSPLLWRKVQRGTSAGRVQSVAVRLVVDREREIQAFVPVEYWTIDARLCPLASAPGGEGAPLDTQSFLARLIEIDGRKAEIPDEALANALVAQLEVAQYAVREPSQKTTTRNPFPPFTTSTLQQPAGNRLRLAAKRTMAAAQALYEAGLITYMRTDSVAVSAAAIAQAREVIADEFGTEYLPPSPHRYSTRTKNAQEAHEAIRPVDLTKTPRALRASLAGDEWRIYDLIWKRMIASQMAGARYLQDVALIDARAEGPNPLAPFPQGKGERSAAASSYPPSLQGRGWGLGSYFTLKAQATTLVFPGWLAVYEDEAAPAPQTDDAPANDRLPPLAAGQPLDLQDLLPEQHFTQPPRRFTEASLVKALEDAGVGRPSTYATVVSTIQDRGYVALEQRHFVPTTLGFAANDFLVAHFPRIVDLPFTAEMEDSLDEIAGGRQDWTRMLHAFYGPFAQTLAQAQSAAVTALKQQEPPAAARRTSATESSAASAEPAGKRAARNRRRSNPAASPDSSAPLAARHCPQCGKPLVERRSEYGPFLGCSGFPACRYIQRDGSGSAGAATGARSRAARSRSRTQRTSGETGQTRQTRQARRPSPSSRRSRASAPPSPGTEHVIRRRRARPQRTDPAPDPFAAIPDDSLPF